MQDINKETKRERVSNRKHKGFVLRFEHTCSTSPPSTLEGFPLKSIPPDHSVPQHLQGEFTHELETLQTQPSASSKYKNEVFGDHNTLIT